MSRHVISVCIFCFICATHSPCASHAAVHGENIVKYKDYHSPHDPPAVDNRPITSREKLKPITLEQSLDGVNNRRHKEKRNSDNIISDRTESVNSDDYAKRLFRMFGDGESMTIEGFKRLVGHLELHRDHLSHEETEHEALEKHFKLDGENKSQETNKTCISEEQLVSNLEAEASSSLINETFFYRTCPLLIYSIVAEKCPTETQNDFEVPNVPPFSNSITWLCSIAAVILISACGVLALAIIPVMQKRFYKPLIQFLVALAVGTLAGDALLHLLPHAMSPTHDHSHSHSHSHDTHDENTMKGCVAMLGLTFFFIMERLISLAGKWRKGKKKHTHSHVTVIKDRRESMNHKNNTQCMDKYNPFPYCYKDIMNNPNKTFLESDRTATTMLDPGSNSDIQSCKKSRSPTIEKLETNQNVIECIGDHNSAPETNKMLTTEHKHDDDYTVILREHKSDHHGHSHKHGHVHAAPQNFSSVAWMVIMGDGLHNFTDGMAIGAAFSGGLAGGFSTTVAVFCHELPHELGDFAMLLKAGMSIKQALFYNILSSVLCIFGNIFGMILGNTEYASSWVFAAAAGMFIYIALVDMIPELSSAHEDEGNIIQCVLHLGGLLLGFAVMALIAFYEHDLKTIFNDPE